VTEIRRDKRARISYGQLSGDQHRDGALIGVFRYGTSDKDIPMRWQHYEKNTPFYQVCSHARCAESWGRDIDGLLHPRNGQHNGAATLGLRHARTPAPPSHRSFTDPVSRFTVPSIDTLHGEDKIPKRPQSRRSSFGGPSVPRPSRCYSRHLKWASGRV